MQIVKVISLIVTHLREGRATFGGGSELPAPLHALSVGEKKKDICDGESKSKYEYSLPDVCWKFMSCIENYIGLIEVHIHRHETSLFNVVQMSEFMLVNSYRWICLHLDTPELARTLASYIHSKSTLNQNQDQ